MFRAFVALLLLTSVSQAAGPFDKMLTVVPGTTNSLVLINAEAVYASPMAKMLKWAEAYSTRYKTGVNTIPPDAKLVAIACSTNMRDTTRDWQLVLTKVPQVPNANALAKREGGSVDEVAGRFAVLSPRDVYFTSIAEDTAAAWYPANRQLLAHWMRGVKAATERTENSLSPFLKDVVEKQSGSHILVAFDLTDAYDLASVRQAVEESPSVAAKSGAKDGLAKVVASIRGLTLAINLTDKMEGALRVEFALDPTPHKSVLKEFLIEAIEDEGASLDDLTKWDASFQGKSMTLKGNFDPSAMARLMTLFEFPSEDEGSENPADNTPNADATKKYFKAVLGIIDEVRALKKKTDYEKTATWHETYAGKITQMSTRNVDPDAVQFALSNAERFRGIAGSLRGVPLDVKRLEAGAHAYVDRSRVVHGWAGRGQFWRLNTNVPQTREKIAKVVADDEKKRMSIWDQIEKSIADTRVKLTTKHGNGF